MSIARIRKNDTVIVIHGNDAGRTGVVQSVDRKKGTAIVSGINVHKKAVRRTERVSTAEKDGKKVRKLKASGKII